MSGHGRNVLRKVLRARVGLQNHAEQILARVSGENRGSCTEGSFCSTDKKVLDKRWLDVAQTPRSLISTA